MVGEPELASTLAPSSAPVTHRLSLTRSDGLIATMFVLLGLLHIWRVGAAPRWSDDEGTYVAQAWAVETRGDLSHYPYWYDHPPLGWMTISAWTWLTAGFERTAAVAAGREAAVIAYLVSAVLIFAIARRIGLSQAFAAVAVLLFSLSPLAFDNHRMVWLDNFAVPWFLAALLVALGPVTWRRAAGAGALMGLAVLTKLTVVLLLPALVVALWMAGGRWRALAAFAGPLVLVVALWPIYALAQGELTADGLSLVEGLRYQLLDRPGSGSVLDPASEANDRVGQWLTLDLWLPIAGVLALPVALARRNLRPIGVGLAVMLVVLLRTGYLPAPYVVAMLPLIVLAAAGALAAVADSSPTGPIADRLRRRGVDPRTAALAVLAIVAVVIVPSWLVTDLRTVNADASAAQRAGTEWVTANVPRDAALLVDDTAWVDLVEAGFAPERVIWFYKLDLDPAVAARFPAGHRDLSYVISSPEMRSQTWLPTTQAALAESQPAAGFGDGGDRIEVRAIAPPPAASGERP